MIDIEKFICSLLADHPVGVTVREDIHKALKDQGLEYKGGKIVPIEDKTALKESEDEEIRKEIVKVFKTLGEGKIPLITNYTDILAWLEKQGKQDNNEDSNILQRFSFYSYKDEPNILYLAGLYVNEEYRNKGIGTKILEVANEVSKSLNCHTIRLKTKKNSDAERLYKTHGYNSLATEEKDEIWLEKQGEQKSIEWHSEDEQNLNVCLSYIPDEHLRRWLKDAIHVKYDKSADKVEVLTDKIKERLKDM